MGTIEQTVSSRPDATPADVWRERSVHTVTGPSGSVMRMRIPGIGTVLATGGLPTYLVRLALLDLSHPEGAASALKQMLDDVMDDEQRDSILGETVRLREYQAHLVAAALIEPALRPEEVLSGDFPEDDLAMIAEIVQRTRAFDALGVRIGVEPLDRWARFHQEHGLDGEDCEHCRSVQQAFSSIDVGAV